MGDPIWVPLEYQFGWMGFGEEQQEWAGHESWIWRLRKDWNVEGFEPQLKELYLRVEKEAGL